MTHVAYPYRFDTRNRTDAAGDEAYVRQLVETVLFTVPGERVNQPEFGSGLLELVFAGNGEALETATQFMVQASLQRWLGDLITVDRVEVRSVDAVLEVTVGYVLRRTEERFVATFEKEV